MVIESALKTLSHTHNFLYPADSPLHYYFSDIDKLLYCFLRYTDYGQFVPSGVDRCDTYLKISQPYDGSLHLILVRKKVQISRFKWDRRVGSQAVRRMYSSLPGLNLQNTLPDRNQRVDLASIPVSPDLERLSISGRVSVKALPIPFCSFS